MIPEGRPINSKQSDMHFTTDYVTVVGQVTSTHSYYRVSVLDIWKI